MNAEELKQAREWVKEQNAARSAGPRHAGARIYGKRKKV